MHFHSNHNNVPVAAINTHAHFIPQNVCHYILTDGQPGSNAFDHSSSTLKYFRGYPVFEVFEVCLLFF